MISLQSRIPSARPYAGIGVNLAIGMVMAVVAWNLDNLVRAFAEHLFPLKTQIVYHYPIAYGAGAVTLLGLFCLDRIWLRPHLKFVGTISKRLALTTVVAVLATYLTAYGVDWLLGNHQEQFMETLFRFQTTPAQMVTTLAALVLLVPIAEELMFRHFILSIFPFQINVWWATGAVIFSAAVFTVMHVQYDYWTTYATLAVFALIVGVARVLSGGVALPMFLHSFAVVISLSVNSLY